MAIVNLQEIAKEFEICDKIISNQKNKFIKILDSVKFTFGEGFVQLEVTNLIEAYKCKIKTESDENKEICVPFDILKKILKAISKKKDKAVEVEIDCAESFFYFGRHKIANTRSSDDFPKLSECSSDNGSEWQCVGGFAANLKKIDISIKNDIPNQYRPRNFILIKDNKVFSTDGKRLHTCETNLESAPFGIKNSSVKIISSLQKHLTSLIKVENKAVIFKTDNGELFCETLQNPDYPDIDWVDKEFENVLNVKKNKIIDDLNESSVINPTQVTFSLCESESKITSFNPEIGEFSTSIDNYSKYQGSEFVVGFNTELILDSLRNFKNEKLSFCFDESKILKITSSGENMIAVIMPLLKD